MLVRQPDKNRGDNNNRQTGPLDKRQEFAAFEVVVIIMPIRNGKIVGRDDFLMSASQYDSSSEIMFAFI